MTNFLLSLGHINVSFTNLAIMAVAGVSIGLLGHSLLVKSTQVIVANRRRSRDSQVRF
jgi:phosphate/sulfate permease